MRSLLWFLSAVIMGLTFVGVVRAHDPDVPELEIPEVSIVGERPPARDWMSIKGPIFLNTATLPRRER